MQEIIKLGNWGGSQSRSVFDSDGISPTLCSGMDHGNTIPYILEIKKMSDEVIRLGCLNGFDGGGFAGQVYDAEGVAPTLTDMQGGGRQPHIVENIPFHVSKVVDGEWGDTKELHAKNIGTETASAVTALYPNHADASDSSNLVLNIRQATKEGSIECSVPGIADLDYPTSQTRRGRAIEGGRICPTLTTENIPSLIEFGNPEFYHFLYKIDGEWYLIRIRKLTPRECWALMDFNEGAFDRAQEVNSNTQLYKQAGNSIVTNVLVAIFGQMFEGKENYYNDEFSGCMNPPEGE